MIKQPPSKAKSVCITDLGDVIKKAKQAAIDYFLLTEKPLGITGEIAEFEAASKLGLELAKEPRRPGFDAEIIVNGKKELIQIKGRKIISGRSGRMGKLDFEKEWDSVILVILDKCFEPREMYKAYRDQLQSRIQKIKEENKKNNKQTSNTTTGHFSVSTFKSIAGNPVWTATAGLCTGNSSSSEVVLKTERRAKVSE